MPLAVLTGIYGPVAKRISYSIIESLVRPTWQLVIVSSPGTAKRSVNIPLLRSTLQSRFQDSPNVLCFKVADDAQRAALTTEFVPAFRFVWLERSWLSLIPHDIGTLFDHINGLLEIEEHWIQRVRPADHRSPLILPEPSFSPDSNVKELWDSANRARDRGHIESTAETINRFEKLHFCDTKRGYRTWVDCTGRIFNHNGPRHGTAPFPRCCKCSFPIPAGFHYDVTSSLSSDFTVHDWKGIGHKVSSGSHINIDAHGYVF